MQKTKTYNYVIDYEAYTYTNFHSEEPTTLIMQYTLYNTNEILSQNSNRSHDELTGNCDVKLHFWTVILPYIQQVGI